MDLTPVTDDLVLYAAGVTALGVLYRRVARPVIRFVAWWDQHGRRFLEHVHAEMSPNSGTSVKDRVESIESKLCSHVADSSIHRRAR